MSENWDIEQQGYPMGDGMKRQRHRSFFSSQGQRAGPEQKKFRTSAAVVPFLGQDTSTGSQLLDLLMLVSSNTEMSTMQKLAQHIAQLCTQRFLQEQFGVFGMPHQIHDEVLEPGSHSIVSIARNLHEKLLSMHPSDRSVIHARFCSRAWLERRHQWHNSTTSMNLWRPVLAFIPHEELLQQTRYTCKNMYRDVCTLMETNTHSTLTCSDDRIWSCTLGSKRLLQKLCRSSNLQHLSLSIPYLVVRPPVDALREAHVRLKSLSLSCQGSNSRVDLLHWICVCSNLVSLRLRHARFDWAGLCTFLARVGSLEHLTLSLCHYGQVHPYPFVMQRLQRLNLHLYENGNAFVATALCTAAPLLQQACLVNVDWSGHECDSFFATTSSSLQKLQLHSNQGLLILSDRSTLPMLHSLALDYTSIDAPSIVSILQRAPHMTSLSLQGCSTPRDLCLHRSAHKCLHTIDLSFSKVTAAAIYEPGAQPLPLKQVLLQGCNQITQEGLIDLVYHHRETLLLLDIRGMQCIDHVILNWIMTLLPSLQCVHSLYRNGVCMK